MRVVARAPVRRNTTPGLVSTIIEPPNMVYAIASASYLKRREEREVSCGELWRCACEASCPRRVLSYIITFSKYFRPMVERYICTRNATGRIAKPRPTRCVPSGTAASRAYPPDAEISFDPERSTDEDERGGWPIRASTMTRRSLSKVRDASRRDGTPVPPAKRGGGEDVEGAACQMSTR